MMDLIRSDIDMVCDKADERVFHAPWRGRRGAFGNVLPLLQHDASPCACARHVSRVMLSRYSHVRMEAKRRALGEIAAHQRAAAGPFSSHLAWRELKSWKVTLDKSPDKSILPLTTSLNALLVCFVQVWFACNSTSLLLVEFRTPVPHA